MFRRWIDLIVPVIVGILVAAALTGMGVVAYVSYLRFWPVKSLDVYSITAPSAVAGRPYFYRIAFCRYTTVPGTVSRDLVGIGTTGVSIPYPALTSNHPPGCGVASVPLTIPLTTPPGRYRVIVTATFRVNLQSVVVSRTSNVFMVSAP